MKKKLIGFLILLGAMLIGVLSCKNLHYKSKYNADINFNDYNLDVEEINIEVQGLKGDYHFLFMTDNQANFDDRVDLGWFGTSENRCFTDASGIASADNFKKWIAFANDSQVDAFLLGGDTIDFCTEENLASVSEYLSNLKMPYLYTYGNHDSYIPWEDRFDDQNPQFMQLFKENDCEFQLMDLGELYIVSIRNYQQDGIAQISQQALEAFKQVVKKGKPIILICHVPICTDETGTLKSMALEHQGALVVEYDAADFGIVNKSVLMGDSCGYELTKETKEFLEILTGSDSPVVMVLSGHLHESWKGYISKNIYQYVGDGAFLNKGAIIHITGK